MAEPLFDMHCHLAFAPNATQAAAWLHKAGAGAFATCVTPEETLASAQTLAPWPCVRVGVGLHPWWVSAGRVGDQDFEQAAALAAQSAFVGEVGLDCSAAHADSFEQQRFAFEQVMRACAEGCVGQGGVASTEAVPQVRPPARVVSLHAVRAAAEVLDVLERTGAIEACTGILHWYSDTPEALQRAIRLGCRFSLGVRSLSTRRGREYARQIPADLLLLETDEPAEGAVYDVQATQAQLAQACAQLEQIKGEPLEELLSQNSRQLLGV